ncbi:hypothetical protein RCH20_000793 [Psychrobacter sp. PL15]|jgi:hypothetical protein|nr:hypothetical protein [Psychrobacter sp. PL15]
MLVFHYRSVNDNSRKNDDYMVPMTYRANEDNNYETLA